MIPPEARVEQRTESDWGHKKSLGGTGWGGKVLPLFMGMKTNKILSSCYNLPRAWH